MKCQVSSSWRVTSTAEFSLPKEPGSEKRSRFPKVSRGGSCRVWAVFCQIRPCEGWDVPRECGSLLGLQAWGISAFAVPFALATDSVHLFVGGDLLLRTGFKRQIPSDL